MHFQITLTSDHVPGYGLVPFRELRHKRANKRKKKDGYQLLLLAGCFENFRVLSYVFIV